MSTSSNDGVFGLFAERIIVPPGATMAQLFQGVAGQNSTVIKNFSGASLLEIIGVSGGMTLTAAQLVTSLNTGYLMGASEILSFDGPTRFYFLNSQSATVIVHAIHGKTAGV